MGFRSFIWAGFFFGMCIAAFANPIWGIVGYMGTYTVGPNRQWWAGPINAMGIRYSFTMSLCTAIGMAIHWRSLRFRFGKSGLNGHEMLILLYLLIAWLCTWFTPDIARSFNRVDPPSMKLTKLIVFTFMLSHVATDLKHLNKVLWILVVGSLVLGLQTYESPPRNRLVSAGGPDFAESNTLSAFMGATLMVVAFQFIRMRGFGRLVCLLSGVFTVNTIILMQSRGGFLGLAAAACVAVTLAPKKHRRKVILGVIVAGAGSFYLMDPDFINRMSTIAVAEEERDKSTSARLEIAKGGWEMLKANPLGVGFGNWYQYSGNYIPEHGGMDAHNTYVKVACELGVQGIAVFLLIGANAFRVLRRIRKRASTLPARLSDEFTQLSFAFTLSLVVLFVCCVSMSLNQMEGLWWFLILPVCLERCLDNAERDLHADLESDDAEEIEDETEAERESLSFELS